MAWFTGRLDRESLVPRRLTGESRVLHQGRLEGLACFEGEREGLSHASKGGLAGVACFQREARESRVLSRDGGYMARVCPEGGPGGLACLAGRLGCLAYLKSKRLASGSRSPGSGSFCYSGSRVCLIVAACGKPNPTAYDISRRSRWLCLL